MFALVFIGCGSAVIAGSYFIDKLEFG